MTSTAAYLIQTGGAERDAVDWCPEFSRRARGIPVHAALRTLGRDGVAALVDRCCGHARRFATLLAEEPGVRILNEVVLNQVLVRFDDDDQATRQVVTGVQQDGTALGTLASVAGDLALAGAPLLARYTGHRAGHAMTNKLLRRRLSVVGAVIGTNDTRLVQIKSQATTLL